MGEGRGRRTAFEPAVGVGDVSAEDDVLEERAGGVRRAPVLLELRADLRDCGPEQCVCGAAVRAVEY